MASEPSRPNNAPSTSIGCASGQTNGNKGIVAENMQATNIQAGDHNTMNFAAGADAELLSFDVEHATANVKANITQIGDNPTIIVGKDKMVKLIDVTNQELDIYKKKEGKLFVESPAFKQCELRVTKNGLVTVFGEPGDGKTTIGLELLCRVRDKTNRKTIIITNEKDWEKVDLSSSQEFVILFDDMLGRFVLNENLKNFWFSQLKRILSFVQDGKIQVIITCRETIFSTAKNELENLELFNAKSRIHLSGSNCEYPLDKETQFDIIKKHIESGGNIEICDDSSKEVLSANRDQKCCISVDTLRKISRKSYVGYMQMCKNFLSSPEFRNEGEKFFDRAGDYLVKEIERLKSSKDKDEKYNYCTLACVLVKQGLNVGQIDEDKTVREIATSCRIEPTPTLKSEINLAVERLTSTYLIKINNIYQFQHNSWMESVFMSFFKSNASLLIEYCEFGLIDLITTENNRDKSAGLCALSDDGEYKSLFLRLVSVMAAGNVRRVFLHRCFTDADFTRRFRDWLESDEERKQAVLMSGERDRDLGWRRDSKFSVLYWAARKSDRDFIVWVEERLRESGKWDMKDEMSSALRHACRGGNVPVCTWLLSQTGIEVRDECILDAARSGSVGVVKTLLNSDTTFSCDDLCDGLCWACDRGDIDVCNEILTQPEVDEGLWWGRCLSSAAQRGNIDVVTALMNYGQFTSDELSEGLYAACDYGHIDVFSLLLTQPGVDGGDNWGLCLSAAAGREKFYRDSRFTSLLKTKGYVIPDV